MSPTDLSDEEWPACGPDEEIKARTDRESEANVGGPRFVKLAAEGVRRQRAALGAGLLPPFSPVG